jgi:hypothetical protein
VDADWRLLSAAGVFGIWLVVVVPVNSQVAAAFRSAPESIPSVWMRLRNRWEYGHVVGFIVQLVGFCALVLSVLVETLQSPPQGDGERERLAIAQG